MGQASSLSAQIENLRYSFRGGDGMAKSPYGETRDPHVWGYQRCGEWDRLPACLRKLKIYATLLEATTGFEPVIRVLQTLALPLGHVAWNAWILADNGCLVKERCSQGILINREWG